MRLTTPIFFASPLLLAESRFLRRGEYVFGFNHGYRD
jgi:hypothetical protein